MSGYHPQYNPNIPPSYHHMPQPPPQYHGGGYHPPQPQQQPQRNRGNGIIFLNMRDPKSQHFMSLFQQNKQQAQMFDMVDISQQPHKFVPSVRNRCGGRTPVVVVRGMQKILVDQEAFQWLASLQQNQQQQMLQQPHHGGGGGGGVPTGFDGGYGGGYDTGIPVMGQNETLNSSQHSHAAMAAATSSLDAMYGGLISQDMKQEAARLEAGGGRGGGGGGGNKLPDNVLDQYLQQRASDVPAPQRPL